MILIANLLFAFWFFLPAGLANIFASLSGIIPPFKNWSYPMDFYARIRGRRILGEHKTIRGLVVGILMGVIVVFLQKQLFLELNLNFQVDYNAINPWILGSLLGGGALLGDAVKSFFKRQLNIAPGDSLIFFDQIDYILGGLFLSSFYVRLDFIQYAYIILLFFVLHFLVNFIGHKLGLREKPI